MPRKTILTIVLILAALAAGLFVFNLNKQKPFSSNPLILQPKKATPSATSIQYDDPSGFSFSYPDNLSIIKNDITDNSTYADLQLSSKDVSGSLNIKIADSKFATLDEWLKLNEKAEVGKPKEVKLGNLKALEIKTGDRLLLGALDQGIFFDIEMPLLETDFWNKAYEKVLANFSFTQADNSSNQGSTTADGVSFESEEVAE